jgi:murein DD-endopeptidase MepM/ murein hydrolase activator NlpD
MGKLLTFLLGALLGGALVYGLFATGRLQVAGTLPVEGIPGASVPPPLPETNGVVLPGVPAAPASVAIDNEALPVEPLAPAPATEDEDTTPALAPATSAANSSEMPVPTTKEGAAAVTAANSSGSLLVPVQGVPAAKLVDTFTQSRGAGRLHDAIDIMAARGTPVLAVADGRVVKLFDSKPGGLTVYQFDTREKLAYYYAHLDHYAPTLAEGQMLKRGDVLGYVGSTGNASPDAPHLHFAVFVLGPEKKWWQGTAVNPYPLLGGR